MSNLKLSKRDFDRCLSYLDNFLYARKRGPVPKWGRKISQRAYYLIKKAKAQGWTDTQIQIAIDDGRIE